MKHKQIKPKKERLIKIGSKTYKVLQELSKTNWKVLLVSIESKFGTTIGEPQPFFMDVSKLEFKEVKK